MHGRIVSVEAHTDYRPDIDGLRAIAVLAVVAYHAFPAVAPGGFVGVDVFFVISGFLITTFILEGLRNNSFSFVEFYARRIKRIFPALLLMLTACLALGWLDFLPDEFQSLGSHVFASAGFWLNFTLYGEAGYFDVKAIYKPLLHLWSLGIEEQFYLLWPILAAVAWRFGRHVAAAAALIVAGSLAVNLLSINAHPVGTFFLPLPRAWELLSGAWLACTPTLGASHRWQRQSASIAGAVLVLVSIFAFSAQMPFPGWRALLPVAGTVLIIAGGSKALVNRTVLAHPALVGIGLISYPLYLWHWPALSFLEILGSATALAKAGAVLLSFGLAWLTYRFIERRVRRAPHFICIYLIAGMIAVGALGLLAKRSIIVARTDTAEFAHLNQVIADARRDWLSPPEASAPFKFEGQTFWKDGTSQQVALIIGDSNAEQYFPRTHELIAGGSSKLSAVYAFFPACLPLPAVTPNTVPTCSDFIAKAFAFAKTPDVKTVTVVAQWFYMVDGRYWFSSDRGDLPLAEKRGRDAAFFALRDQLSSLRRLGKRTIVILNIPIGGKFAPVTRVGRSFGGVQLLPPPRAFAQDVLKSAEARDIIEGLRKVAEQSGSEVVDPFDTLCTSGICQTADQNGDPIYKDSVHLRASFVRRSATFIDKILD